MYIYAINVVETVYYRNMILWEAKMIKCVKWAMEGAVTRRFEVIVERSLTAGIIRQIDQVVTEDFQGQSVKVV